MVRAPALLWLLLAFAAGCWEDRVRPSPFEPSDTVGLSVDLLRPLNNQVVVAGQPVPVEVVAADLAGETLIGIGFVAHRLQGAVRLDSVVTFFPPGPSARDTFELIVPAGLPTSTQLSIRGLALRANGASRRSGARNVVVAQCGPDQPGCD